ncbi:MAG TPA: hypothetical protein VM841_02615 [Actinomycetota bacterium]|nr:hypothetical protein [Actinomycetota bacterium]
MSNDEPPLSPPPAEPSGPDLSRLRRFSVDAKPPKPERDVHIGRLAAFVGAALFVIVVPWLVFTRVGDSGPARPRATVSPSVSASPAGSPSPTVNPEAGVYELVGEVECVRIRIDAGTDKEILNCIKPGVRLESDGEMREADNFVWLHVEDPFKGIDGWVATQYVKRVS